MNRHAYLVLAHKNFGQLRKLLELLDDERNDIYVHVDAKVSFDPSAWTDVCTKSGLSFLRRRIRVNWGGVNSLKAELALIGAALDGGEYSYLHLISGLDLPIKSQDFIHAFFEAHAGREFVNFNSFKSDLAERFNGYTPFPELEKNFLVHAVNKLVRSLYMRLGFRRNRDVDFRYGANWFSITPELAEYVLSKEAWLLRIFSHTCNCDELFLTTLVWNSTFREKVYMLGPYGVTAGSSGNKRLVDWSRPGCLRHPWVFRDADYDFVMSSDELWARKFDEKVDGRIIDRIYSKLKPV